MRRTFAISVVFMLAAGVAAAQSGPVNLCVNPNSGEVKLAKGTTCPQNQTLVTLNSDTASSRPTRTGPDPLLVVDSIGQQVGYPVDPLNGMVVRKEGGDAVLFVAPQSGFQAAPIIFFHQSADCTDDRYLQITDGQGLVFFGQVHGGAVFYTKTLDPFFQVSVPIHAYEQIPAGQDATLAGVCTPWDGGNARLGVVTTAIDPALATLVPPFQVQ